MNYQLNQDALEGVPQSEEDKLAVLKWEVTLVSGQEEDAHPNEELMGNHSLKQWNLNGLAQRSPPAG